MFCEKLCKVRLPRIPDDAGSGSHWGFVHVGIDMYRNQLYGIIHVQIMLRHMPRAATSERHMPRAATYEWHMPRAATYEWHMPRALLMSYTCRAAPNEWHMPYNRYI